ncbi:MAG: ABC transporter ATP-binding protein [Nitrospiria bacterium]
MIRIENLSMSLASAGRAVPILKDINLHVPKKELLAIVGPSGSGKSTLLGLMAGLDRPTGGSIVVDGVDLSTLSEDALATLRRERIGMVFQSFHLIPTMSALENVQIPLELQGRADAAREARRLMIAVGLEARCGHYPVQLSGGEQQRVAVARAYAGSPALLLADEPTGNLDSKNGARVIDLLFNLHRDLGNTFVLVTHDMALAERADRIITLRDGEIAEDHSNT